jgi:sugar lactone lactonase YvrE
MSRPGFIGGPLLALVAILGLALLAPAAALAEYSFVAKWGSGGSGDGQFRAPYGVVADSFGNVYVTDFGNGLGNNDRVEKFDSTGGFLTKWGGLGSGDTQFHDPWGVATDSEGNVYVADVNNHYIKKFDPSGVFALKFGGAGSANGQFGLPFGVAVDPAGNIYVADHDGSPPSVDRVQKFKPALGGYVYDDQWGITGSEPGQFNEPSDVAVDTVGNVYVSDRKNHRLQKFDSEGFFIAQWGGMGSGNGQLAFPEGIATDPAGNVYVADTGNDRIQKFYETGAPLPGGGGAGGGGGGGPVIDVSNEFKIENTTVLSKNGALKFKLKLPAPGIVEAIGTVKAPPRPPSLDPGHREHEGHRSRLAKAKAPVTMAKGSASATAAGPLTLIVTPTKKGRKFLGWKSPLKATVKVIYKPTGGTPSSISRPVKFELTKKSR